MIWDFLVFRIVELALCYGTSNKVKLTLLRLKPVHFKYEGWNFNSGNYLFTTDTK